MVRNQTHMGQRLCPACGSSAGRGLGQKNEFHLVSCQGCGTSYTSFLPDAATAQKYYDNYYGSHNLMVPAFIGRRADEIIAEFSRYRWNNRLLEVGFGPGTLLQAAARAGWSSEGVEVSHMAVEHLRSLGLRAFHGELAAACYPTSSFDIVVASELLEHVVDPKTLLQEIARLLRPGGLFWATTPHARGISARVLGLQWSTMSPPEHLQLFSLHGTKTLLAAVGFRRIRVVAHGANPFEILYSLRHRSRLFDNTGGFDRVDSSYRLNAFLTENAGRRALKKIFNAVLSASRLGDSLKIRAAT